jgi:lysophospholipase L1-like esterase
VSVRNRIGISAAATLLSLAACEVAARVFFPAPPDPTRQPQIVYRVDPEIRYVLSPNQKGWVDDGFVTTNSRGFRGREVEIPKPHGRLRIVALGDSVTFGWGVNDADTFCYQLEQQLRTGRPGLDVDVVNLAVPGYATRQEVALLKRNLADLQPDVVLVGFYANDLPDTLDDKGSRPSGTRIEAPRTEAGQVLHMNPAPSSWIERQARRSRAIYTATHAAKRLIHRGEGKPGSSMELDLLESRGSVELETAWQQVSTQLAELRKSAADFGFSAGIVVLPPREQVLGLFSGSDYQKRIHQLADQQGLFVVDPLPSLVAGSSKKPSSLFIPYDRNHPSPTGHRLIAQAIVEYFNEHGNVVPVAKHLARSERAQ